MTQLPGLVAYIAPSDAVAAAEFYKTGLRRHRRHPDDGR